MREGCSRAWARVPGGMDGMWHGWIDMGWAIHASMKTTMERAGEQDSRGENALGAKVHGPGDDLLPVPPTIREPGDTR